MRDTEGKYGGLGMIITLRDNRLTILKDDEKLAGKKELGYCLIGRHHQFL